MIRCVDALHNVLLLRTIETPAGRGGNAHTLELMVSWTELEATIEALVARGADAENVHPYYAARDLPEETLWRRPKVQRMDPDDRALLSDNEIDWTSQEIAVTFRSTSRPRPVVVLLG